MKLKCIGGVCGGQIVDINSYTVKGDICRVPIKITFEISSFEDELQKLPSKVAQPYAYYKVETFDFINPNTKLTFLIPEKWSLAEAMTHLISSHHGI